MGERTLLDDIIAIAARASDVTVADLQSNRKNRKLAHIRGVISWYAHEEHGYSYPQIGRAMCKHHTTILYAACREMARQDAENSKATTGPGAVVVKMEAKS